MRRGGPEALRAAVSFFLGEDPIHASLRGVAGAARRAGHPVRRRGGMAASMHGSARMTVEVDVLLRAQDLRRVHESLARALRPPREFGARLDPSVRTKFEELRVATE